MTAPIGAVGAPPSKDALDAATLRRTAQQLEGLFVRQLFSAMRETVPEGAIESGSGEQMFTGMLDEHLADAVPARWQRSLATDIASQLQRRLHSTSEQP